MKTEQELIELLDYYEDLRAFYFIQNGIAGLSTGEGLLAFHHASVIKWILGLESREANSLQKSFDNWQECKKLYPETRDAIERTREILRKGS